jgi:hypothetical protein
MKKVVLFLAVVLVFTACKFDVKSDNIEIKADSTHVADSVHIDSLTVKK